MGPNADKSRLRRTSKLRHRRWLAATLCMASPLALAAGSSPQWSCSADEAGHWVCRPEARPAGPYAAPAVTQGKRARDDRHAAPPRLTAAELDWYPRSALTEAQQALIPPFCPGMYIEPANSSPTAGIPFDKAQVNATADTTDLVPNKSAVLNGNVQLTRGNLRLTADHAVVDFEAKTVTLDGNIIVRDNGRMVRGDHAVISTADGTGTMDNAHYVLYRANARGNAATIRRVSDNITKLTRGSYTHCPPGDEAWRLTAKNIKIDHSTGLGTAKNAVLRIADIPMFYIPYATFPVDDRRRSGFLWPTISSARGTGGLDLTVPYYWNIAPNADATIAPRYIKGRGLDTELEFRHLTRYSNLVTSGSYLNDQDYGAKRWLIGVNENGNFGPGWYHNIDYTKVSDDNYFSDLSAQSLAVKRRTQLTEQAAVGYLGTNWHVSTTVRRYQTIDDQYANPYQLMPQVAFAKSFDNVPFRPDWMIYGQVTQFDIVDNNRPRGSRAYLEPGLSLPMEWAWGYLRPTVKALSVAYKLDQQRPTPTAENEPSTVAPLGSVDAGLYFDRSTTLFGSHYTNTLEPRLYYLYVQPKNQRDQPNFDTRLLSFDYYQLWRETRFSGYDRIADANQISVGLTSRLINNDTGTQTLSASIGQIFYFSTRDVTLSNRVGTEEKRNKSDLASELTWRLSDNFMTLASAVYNQSTNKLDNAGVQLRYWDPTGLILNVGQHYRRQPGNQVINGQVIDNTINQSDISAIVPVARKWALIGRWNYDYTNNRNLEQLVGVEYDSCCWRFRVLYQAGIDGNNKHTEGIYFQFQLKGLGGLGGPVDGILQDSIPGYELREKSLQE